MLLVQRHVYSEDDNSPNITTEEGHTYEVRLRLPNRDVYKEVLRWLAPDEDFPSDIAEQFEVHYIDPVYGGAGDLVANLVCSKPEPIVGSEDFTASLINFSFNYNEEPEVDLGHIEQIVKWAKTQDQHILEGKKNAISAFSKIKFDNWVDRVEAACEAFYSFEVAYDGIVPLNYDGKSISHLMRDDADKYQHIDIFQFYDNLKCSFVEACDSIGYNWEDLPEDWRTDQQLLLAFNNQGYTAKDFYKLFGDKSFLAIEDSFQRVLDMKITHFINDW